MLHTVLHTVFHTPPSPGVGRSRPNLSLAGRPRDDRGRRRAADAERRSKTAPRPAALRRCWRWTFAQAPGGTGTVRRCPGRAPAGPVPTGIPAGRNGPLSRSGRPVSAAGPERNRDRGEPRGSAPPTPPCVRVRTRRFDGVKRHGLRRRMRGRFGRRKRWAARCRAPG